MKKIIYWIAVYLALVPAICMAESSVTPIKIGIVLSLTGAEFLTDVIQRNSFRLAADEINRAGGINGRPLELIIEDDNGQSDLAGYAAEKLIMEDKVEVLTGASYSESAMAIGRVANERKAPFLITTGSVNEVTEQGWEYVFRISPPLNRFVNPLESFLENVVKPETLAIIYGDWSYGSESADYLEKAFQKIGGRVVAREVIRIGSTDFRPILSRIKRANPDMVFISSSSTEGAILLRQSRELGLSPKIFVGSADGFTIPDFALVASGAADYVFSFDLWSPRLPYAGALKYFDDYVLRFLSSTNYLGAEAYASIQVIADALKRAKSLTSDEIRQALATTDMETVFGPVRFVSEGKQARQNFVPTFLGQWIGGTLEIVWPKEFATAPYVYPTPRVPSKP
jgi:branched-chain amino acid transport system substrate-binding protein